ncbi:MAG: lipoprotein signal peptidase [Chitinophagales bacterium]|jgi:signal peptidase II|nr:lipoprotein signal peptidase [Sphingobacteriales bacterium]
MNQRKNCAWMYWLFAIILIAIDQASKIYVKTNFYMGEEVMVIPTWFRLVFTENPGVAFGMEWGGTMGKYFLSVFRIIFSLVIAFFLYKSIQKKEHKGLLIAGVLILAGAVGNVIDGIFYGAIFSASSYHLSNVAEFVSFSQGYAPLLQGKVVDMFYFPLFDGVFPSWMPIYGGQPFSFFNAIFNVADACISVGLVLLLIFMRKYEEKAH